MFVNAWIKDYEIQLDGKPYTVRNERWIGVITENPEKYFSGSIYDYDKKTGTYSHGGTTAVSKAEFQARVSDFVLFK